MLNEDQELYTLLNSLESWASKTNNKFVHKPYKKYTCSLYRFGMFYINDYEYSISQWRFRDCIISFFTEETGDYITFDITNSNVIDKTFAKDAVLVALSKKIRIKIVGLLRKLSDKLQP